MPSLLADPWIAARVDEAVGPYVGRLPPHQIQWMREQLAETLASDPAARALLEGARPRVVDESGEVVRGAAVGGGEHGDPRRGLKSAG